MFPEALSPRNQPGSGNLKIVTVRCLAMPAGICGILVLCGGAGSAQPIPVPESSTWICYSLEGFLHV